MSSDNDRHHPEETPVERLLREALDARAQQVTAQSLRPSAPPKTRIRRLRPVVTAAVPLFGLAAGVVGYVTLSGTPTALHREQPPAATITATPTPSPTDSPSPSASASASASASVDPSDTSSPTAPQAGKPFTYKGVNLTVPAGWTTSTAGGALCVVPSGAPTKADPAFSCRPYGVQISVYATKEEVTEQTYPGFLDVEGAAGWANQPGWCFSSTHPSLENNADGSPKMQTGQKYTEKVEALAGHQAREATWNVKCASGDTFTARRWDFSLQQVYIMTSGLAADREADLQSILGSLDLSGVKGNLGATPLDGALVRRDGIGASCQDYQVKQDDPTIAVATQVLQAAQNRDYAKLAQLYHGSAADLSHQQQLWHQDGVLDQLVRILTETHLKTTDGQTWPSFVFAPNPSCVQEQADLALFDLAKASDYHGVTTIVSTDGQTTSWNGITMR